MRILSGLLFLCFLSFESKAQLDPVYFTTYVNSDLTESYIIYLPEDEVKDCFWVEYEKFENYRSVYGETGIGKCNDAKEMTMVLKSSDTERKVSFGRNKEGMRVMNLHLPNETVQTFTEVSVEEEFEEEFVEIEDVFYTAENGNLLVIFDDEGGLGFTLSGSLENACDENQLGGTLTPRDDSGEHYSYKDGSCELNLDFTEDKVKITQKNCKMKGECPSWNGDYFFGE